MDNDLRAAAEADDFRMDAYYYYFDATGERAIDIVLSAIACAGKAFHHTECWQDECGLYETVHRGDTPVAWIQNAASDAAEYVKQLRADRDALAERVKVLVCALQDARTQIDEDNADINWVVMPPGRGLRGVFERIDAALRAAGEETT